jgi:hypothetical protein
MIEKHPGKGAHMAVKESIKSQYHAALAMLTQAIEKCPDAMWVDTDYVNPFWRVAYHTIIYTTFYLSPTEGDFIPWEGHKDGMQLSGDDALEADPYSKADLLAFLDLCCKQVDIQVESLDIAAGSGFDWLPFDKMELQLYNIRHIQQHTGELCERLGAQGEIQVDWVGMNFRE